MRNRSRQSGFTVVEVLLSLIFVAILAFAGYYVWHSNKNQTKTTPSTTSTKKSTGTNATVKQSSLSLSSEDTYYDCVDVLGANSIDANYFNQQTGTCHFNNTGGQAYTYPTSYSDNMIRNARGVQFTSSEVVELQTVARKLFNECSQPPAYAEINLYGEANGKYLYFGVECGDGHRQLEYLDGSSWKIIASGQFGIDCKTITDYQVPQSILVAGKDTECVNGDSEVKINTLQGYTNYAQ